MRLSPHWHKPFRKFVIIANWFIAFVILSFSLIKLAFIIWCFSIRWVPLPPLLCISFILRLFLWSTPLSCSSQVILMDYLTFLGSWSVVSNWWCQQFSPVAASQPLISIHPCQFFLGKQMPLDESLFVCQNSVAWCQRKWHLVLLWVCLLSKVSTHVSNNFLEQLVYTSIVEVTWYVSTSFCMGVHKLAWWKLVH